MCRVCNAYLLRTSFEIRAALMAKDIFAQCFDYTSSNRGPQFIVPKMKLLSTILFDERYGGMIIIEMKLNHSKIFKKDKKICSVPVWLNACHGCFSFKVFRLV